MPCIAYVPLLADVLATMRLSLCARTRAVVNLSHREEVRAVLVKNVGRVLTLEEAQALVNNNTVLREYPEDLVEDLDVGLQEGEYLLVTEDHSTLLGVLSQGDEKGYLLEYFSEEDTRNGSTTVRE